MLWPDRTQELHEMGQALLRVGIRATALIAGTAGDVGSFDHPDVAPGRAHRQREMRPEEYRRIDAQRGSQMRGSAIHGVELVE